LHDLSARRRGWYESLFVPCEGKRPRAWGESSPNYTKCPFFRGIPQRMHDALPEAKLIYLVRDPIARMVSHYRHNFAKGKETRPINAALYGQRRGIYLNTSRYYTQLRLFLKHYSPERVLVLSTEEMQTDRRAALVRVFDFLGVDKAFDSPVFDAEYFVTAARFSPGRSLDRYFASPRLVYLLGKLWPGKLMQLSPPIEALEDRTRHWLAEQLQPEVEELRSLSGQQFRGWSV
jgi:hypothetical protein